MFYQPEHNGGGIKFFPEYLKLLKGKKYPHVMEFCAGPGFIAFALLATQIADRLTLVDVNEAVVPGVMKTIKENGLVDKVEIRIGNGLQALGTEDMKFDLVVSNPPHIDVSDPETGTIPYNDRPIIYSDPGFIIHKEFYRNIGKFLTPKGEILFIENGMFSNHDKIVGRERYPNVEFVTPPLSELPGKYYMAARRV